MQIKDFEKQIQKDLDKELSIRTNPNHPDIAGVYYKDMYLGVAVPPTTIKEVLDPDYRDAIGHPYKFKQQALDQISGKLEKFKKALVEDPDLFK